MGEFINSALTEKVLDGLARAPDSGRGLRGFVGRNRLKLYLVAGDLASVLVAYGAALVVTGYSTSHRYSVAVYIAMFAVVSGFWAIRSQGLLLARVSAIRVVELTRATRATAIVGAAVLLLDRVAQLDMRIYEVLTASVLMLVLLVIWRSAFRWRLTTARASGQFCRRVLLIGANEETKRLVDLIEIHREVGIKVVGLVGDRTAARKWGLDRLWLGAEHQAEELIRESDVSGLVVLPQEITSVRMNALIREAQRDGIHVFVATGFSGIDSRRVRSMSLAHEPMLYVEPPSLARTQVIAKRVFDVVFSAIALVLASPVLLVTAAAVKLTDGGPVFFRQKRVGKSGVLFSVLKFRTMAVDAEQQLAKLSAANERSGPLFKMVSDPRVTRVGRFLRESSLDELPQLINVLRGQMSLVGPRPALPAEVEHFPEALRAREQVMPGITGLWQVEARDNPSFEAYRRLDLFYVENWSLTLDFMIIVGTLEQISARLLMTVFRRHKDPVPLTVLSLLPSVVDEYRDLGPITQSTSGQTAS
ncbi:MAG: sugar transferase [Ilumatobacteraceae bacterium]